MEFHLDSVRHAPTRRPPLQPASNFDFGKPKKKMENTDVVLLHGWGQCPPEESLVYKSLRNALPEQVKIHAPAYHPPDEDGSHGTKGGVLATRVTVALGMIEDVLRGSGRRCHIVGYSVGGSRIPRCSNCRIPKPRDHTIF